jgi:N-acetylglucosaminyl-diphospho-decaprenol L-rhamnosyltransferase
MKICAIVLNYFGAHETEKCLRSIVNQALDTIYIVDNSASRSEAQNLTKLVQEFSSKEVHTIIKLLFNDKNLGFPRAMNRALKYDIEDFGGHDFYILLNNDAQATPGMVQKLLDKMNQNPDISLIAPRILTSHGEIGYFWYNKLFGCITFEKRPLSFPFISGCCLLFRRSLIEDRPLFDKDFFMYGDDASLSWRLYREGLKIFLADDIFIIHEGTTASPQGNLFYEYYVSRAHILMVLKTWARLYELPLFILGRLLYLSSRSIIRSVRYRTFIPIIAFFLCWFPLKIKNKRK